MGDGGLRPIIGHNTAWGLVGRQVRVQPYRLTPGATDTMEVRVREKIDIQGVGTDVVELVGTFTVRRDHPRSMREGVGPQWGEARIGTEFRDLELYGESSVFGTVRVRLDPSQVSQGVVGPAARNSEAAGCEAQMHPVIELEDLNMTLHTGGQAVRLASKVIQIPPVGDVARSTNSVQLQDEGGNVLGEIVSSDIEVGPVLSSIPLGNFNRPIGLDPVAIGMNLDRINNPH